MFSFYLQIDFSASKSNYSWFESVKSTSDTNSALLCIKTNLTLLIHHKRKDFFILKKINHSKCIITKINDNVFYDVSCIFNEDLK